MSTSRPHLPSNIETEVLIRSRRRCCLCFGLNFDTDYKRIQIAHLDGDRENNKIDNLAALCQQHHDEYDSVYKQTKGITVKELKHHRSQLYSALDKSQQNLALNSFNLQNSANIASSTVSTPSAHLLGRVLEAYDIETDKCSKGGRANGISLLYLASIAIDEFGDFDVAYEALLSLTRLISISNKGWPVLSFSHIPSTSPEYCAMSVLYKLQTRDFFELVSALSRLSDWAVQEKELEKEITINEMQCKVLVPNKRFEAFTRIMYCCFRENAAPFASWAQNHILGFWKSLTVQMSLHLFTQGFQMPEELLSDWIKKQMNDGGTLAKWFNEDNFRPDILFVLSCHRLSRLPETYFEKIANMKYEVNFSDYRAKEAAPRLKEVLSKIQQNSLRSALISGTVEFNSKDEAKAENECRRLIQKVNVFGSSVLGVVGEKLELEHKYIYALNEGDRAYLERF